ncbi:AAA family ATPase [Nordella sp. HKS 07]|uniref:adenylate/guanylate cyclase domain-containing protein n=1 Tax=Nordella sp. HKS 07 TaxID=2712222 RepID=UPI0013E1EC21|nr:adenylate/guanylate cyclase domain-containing protein [Nordella sp. HKS 07]QIG47933.1 AAA family ATPase [Nordella sp. HKS 07]
MNLSIDQWLTEHGLEMLAGTMHANDIDLEILQELSESELAALGVSLGNRKRLLKALANAKKTLPPTAVSSTPIGERRQVTILFADIVGFTTLSDRLDPEDTHRLLGRYFHVVDRIVADFGGSIDKHIGDAVMAVFGAPKSHGNDAERAVRAANAIHEALSSFEPRLDVHIGVAGGEVLASQTGSEDHAEYTVTGPSVNLASRLQGVAGAGETLVSESVYQAIAGFTACESRGEIQVKGLGDALKVWCLAGVSDRRGVSSEQVFVGRRNELQQALGVLDALFKNSSGSVLYIRGEAGIGKTRFVDQVEKHAQTRGAGTHAGLILDFGVAQGEDAITLLLRSLCSVPARTDKSDVIIAVRELVEKSVITPSDQVHAFALLGISQPSELKPIFDALDNEARKSGRLRTLSSILRHAAKMAPLFLRVEDVHWADEAILQSLATIAGETAEHPILLVMTSRVEGEKIDHSWRASARDCSFSTLDLGPLRKDDAMVLASGYLSATDGFAQKCIDRAAGNPLFLEQLLRSKQGDAVPGSVQSIVQARIDQLSETDRTILRAASVLGQRFSLAAVRAMIKDPGSSCSNLVAQHLVRPQEEDYLFAHALVRDGVYQSIVLNQRKDLHSAAAGWFAGRDMSLRAWHLGMAADPSAPSAYLDAAQAHAEAHRHDRATEHCKTALGLNPQREIVFSLLALLGEVQLESNDPAGSIDTFELALQTAEHPLERARALTGLASAMRLVDRLADAEVNINEAIELAGREENHLILSKAYFLRGNLEWPRANYSACITNHQASLDHARASSSIELEVQALGGLGDANYLRGCMITANEHFELCVRRADEGGLARVAAANRPMLAWCAIYKGELDLAWNHAIEARENAQSISHKRSEIIALNALALIAAERGDVASIFHYTEPAMALARELGSQRFQAMVLMLQSKAFFIEGSPNRAAKYLHTALDLASQTLSFIGPWIMGGLVLAADSPTERRQWLDQGLSILQNSAVSHNYLFFHADAMDAHLIDRNWDGVRKHAELLDRYTTNEPLPLSSFMIERARWAAAIGENTNDHELRAVGRQLQSRGHQMGLKRSLELFSNFSH